MLQPSTCGWRAGANEQAGRSLVAPLSSRRDELLHDAAFKGRLPLHIPAAASPAGALPPLTPLLSWAHLAARVGTALRGARALGAIAGRLSGGRGGACRHLGAHAHRIPLHIFYKPLRVHLWLHRSQPVAAKVAAWKRHGEHRLGRCKDGRRRRRARPRPGGPAWLSGPNRAQNRRYCWYKGPRPC